MKNRNWNRRNVLRAAVSIGAAGALLNAAGPNISWAGQLLRKAYILRL
jgi:hypothetical protein